MVATICMDTSQASQNHSTVKSTLPYIKGGVILTVCNPSTEEDLSNSNTYSNVSLFSLLNQK